MHFALYQKSLSITPDSFAKISKTKCPINGAASGKINKC